MVHWTSTSPTHLDAKRNIYLRGLNEDRTRVSQRLKFNAVRNPIIPSSLSLYSMLGVLPISSFVAWWK